MTSQGVSSHYVQVDGLTLHFLEAGAGEPLVLLHGWPTSSYLWRNIVPRLAGRHWVLAPDLPGFGRTDKPLGPSYTLNYHCHVLDRFLQGKGIQQLSLVVHDLGGPIGLLWAVRNAERLRRLVIMDTFLRLDLSGLSFFMKLILLCAHTPILKNWLVSPTGIASVMRGGSSNREAMTKEVLSAYQAPFAKAEARRVLLKTLTDLNPTELEEVNRRLPELGMPISIIYGEDDAWFAAEASRLHSVLPQAEFALVPQGNHFVQEDQPGRVGELLAGFLADAN